MRALLSLITMGLLAAQDLPIGESRHPQPIKPFDLNYFDIRTAIYDETGIPHMAPLTVKDPNTREEKLVYGMK